MTDPDRTIKTLKFDLIIHHQIIFILKVKLMFLKHIRFITFTTLFDAYKSF